MQNGQVSRYPQYFRKTPRSRTLAYGELLYNEREEPIGYHLRREDDQAFQAYCLDDLLFLIECWHCDLYLGRLYGKRGFIWLAELLERPGTEALIATSSQTLVQLGIRIGRSIFRLISTGTWEYGAVPSLEFLQSLRRVFQAYERGTYASPSALGHVGIQFHMQAQNRRTQRPNHMLSRHLYEEGVGGRAEDFAEQERYEQVFEIDRGNSFGQSILDNGVPLMEDCETKGTRDVYDSELRDYTRYVTAYCQAEITIPDGCSTDGKHHKFSPFACRRDNGELEYPTSLGTYRGYFWLETLRRCAACGYHIRLAYSYCWQRLSFFLSAWVKELIMLRSYFKSRGLSREEGFIKMVIVSSIGRFGMQQKKLTLILAKDKQPGDEPFFNMHASQGEALSTEYYVHEEQEPDAPHLVQIAQHVINDNNLALFDRCVEEEKRKNKVIATNFDAIFLIHPTTIMIPTWKEILHTDFRPMGKRSYESIVDGEKRRRRPGVRKE